MNKSIKKWIYNKFREWFGIEIHKIQGDPKSLIEIKRLKRIPSGVTFETTLLGRPVKGNHRGSFLFQYRELFQQNAYEFKTSSSTPFIIDCGVNIGLSIIYFKKKFPGATIIGFEPDETLYDIATHNLSAMGITGVDLLKKGVWKENGKISFYAEGADAGRIAKPEDEANLKVIETVRLSDYIDKQVDFLKIDIEGAELSVLEECAFKLDKVNQLFIEYHSFRHEKQQLSKLIAILEEAGFRYNISTPKVLNAKPYVMTTDYQGIDFLLNIYAFR